MRSTCSKIALSCAVSALKSKGEAKHLRRLRVPEIMDDPTLPSHEHEAALRGLERLNVASGSAQIIWREIEGVCSDRHRAPTSLLDIATGSGDIPLALAARAKAHNVALQLFACDMSEQALEVARMKANTAGEDIELFRLNCINDEIPECFDIITTSLFTHHLDPPQVIALIASMRKHAKKMILINDLDRSVASYICVWLATRLLTNSAVVHFDGPASVRAAYTAEEFSSMAFAAGLTGYSLKKKLPCRLLLSWQAQPC